MSIVELFLTLQNQLRIYHWETESYAEHKALGNAYETLDDLIDSFMEIHIGKYKRPVASDKFNITLFNYADNFKDNIDAYIEVLEDKIPQALNEKDTDLLNIRDEMLGALNQLKYLLTLK
jgi:hypothetical protein